MAVIVPYVVMAVVSVAVSYAMQAMAKGPLEGMRLGEIVKQTSEEGGPRLILYGIVRPIGGNIVACSDPKKTLLMSLLGKGGDSTLSGEAVYRTYAIGICEGPVTGVLRVWRNNKLVYDAREGSTWGPINNSVFLQRARFYLGDYSQVPDSSLEAVWGVGNIPAMRGTCYMVMNNEDLTQLGGAVPQYIFEVVRAEGFILTSRPYAVEKVESSEVVVNAITEGEFRAILLQYSDGPESISTSDAAVTGGVFRATLLQYSDGLPEGINTGDAAVTGGVYKKILIENSNGLPEGINALDATITGGTHEVT